MDFTNELTNVYFAFEFYKLDVKSLISLSDFKDSTFAFLFIKGKAGREDKELDYFLIIYKLLIHKIEIT